jgi:hypothetical protein
MSSNCPMFSTSGGLKAFATDGPGFKTIFLLLYKTVPGIYYQFVAFVAQVSSLIFYYHNTLVSSLSLLEVFASSATGRIIADCHSDAASALQHFS